MYGCARLAGVTAARAARPHHRAPSGAGSRGVPFSAPACRGRSGAGARARGRSRKRTKRLFFSRGAARRRAPWRRRARRTCRRSWCVAREARVCALQGRGGARQRAQKELLSPPKKKALLFCASASAPSRARWRLAGHIGHAFTPNDSLGASGCEERSRRAAGAALGALGAQPRPYVPLSSPRFLSSVAPRLRALAARGARARRP